MTITDDAKQLISSLSEGYPHFLQEFSYCAFEQDTDNIIDRNDVSDSLFRENGSFDQLGKKYFNQYYSAPSSDDYRLILDKMAEHDAWVSRGTLISDTGLKPGTIDNGLRALNFAISFFKTSSAPENIDCRLNRSGCGSRLGQPH